MTTPLPLCAILRSFTSPPDIVVERQAVPAPAAGELLLAMERAPINPADLNVLEGKYGELPKLPSPVGNEGVGRVLAMGEGVQGWEVGDLVLPMQRGTWVQQMTVPADQAIRLPSTIDLDQAAMLSVNPATAWLLLREVVPLQAGQWVVQNAANSGVGRCVLQLARHWGLRVLSVVRRPELQKELEAEGVGPVLLETDDLRAVVKDVCGSERPRLALNSVGGSSALQLAQLLAPRGTLVTFGAMSKQALKIPNGLLIFQDLLFCGFWLTRWLRNAELSAKQELYGDLARLVEEGKLTQPVAQVLPLSQLSQALALAATERRAGKILLSLSEMDPA